MVARLGSLGLVTLVLLVGCSPAPQNLEAGQAQPPADLEKAAQAQTIEQWAAANPSNGLPGHGESEDK